MKLLPLLDVKSQVKVGVPLPFGIRDEHGQLLLSRGHLVDSEATLEVLLQRGATVDFEEAQPAHRREPAIVPPSENFPGRWHQLSVRAGVVLRPPLADDALERVRELGEQLGTMAERQPDLLLYLTLRGARDPGAQYAVLHALHAAVVALLVARRLGWPAAQQASLVGAALTMNLAIVELLSRLHGVAQAQPLPPAQREMIDRHPADSAQLLRAAGLDDSLWLQAVEQHHPLPAGAPPLAPAATELVRLLRLVDAYTARITERADTIIASPALAARELFAQHAGDPLALTLVKEMGVYPPGCFVRIASGETAVVLRRGASANTPEVACVTNRRGDALQTPIRRDTGLLPEHAITAVVPDKDVKVRVPSQQLYC